MGGRMEGKEGGDGGLKECDGAITSLLAGLFPGSPAVDPETHAGAIVKLCVGC
jgi:hypothetical protein